MTAHPSHNPQLSDNKEYEGLVTYLLERPEVIVWGTCTAAILLMGLGVHVLEGHKNPIPSDENIAPAVRSQEEQTSLSVDQKTEDIADNSPPVSLTTTKEESVEPGRSLPE